MSRFCCWYRGCCGRQVCGAVQERLAAEAARDGAGFVEGEGRGVGVVRGFPVVEPVATTVSAAAGASPFAVNALAVGAPG